MDRTRTLDSPESWADTGASAVGKLTRGASIDRYLVVDKIGAGGMGIVYAAYDPELDRRIAIKIMRPSGLDTTVAGKIRERTMREARGMAQLAHPNVVGIYDVGTFDDAVFLAMELIDGGSLKDWLAGEPNTREIIAMFVGAGRGLAAAHQQGLIHRDFKPDNVMVTKSGRAQVTDFGLVRDVAGAHDEDAPGDGGDIDDLAASSARLTQTGAFLGTPHYMAPEQLERADADARSDQFSFCVALFEALWKAHPYPASTLRERIEALRDPRPPQIPRETNVPSRVSRAILRGLSIDPAARFATMDELLDELTAAFETARWRRLATVVALAAAVAAGALAYRSVVAAPASSACKGAEQRLETVWNPTRGREIERAFAAVGGAFAASAAERVLDAFDRYGTRWRQLRIEACEATHKYREQAEGVMQLRMRCLDRRLGDMDALVATLVKSDAAGVQESVAAANKLEALEGCSDIDALTAQVPPPDDAATRAAVDLLEPTFSQLRSLHLAGGYTEGSALAAAQLAAAKETAYRPAQARAFYWAGVFAFRNEQYERAREDLEESVWLAEASGDDELAAMGWIASLTNVGRKRASLAEVPTLERRASAAIERLRAPPRLVMELNSALGLIAHEAGRFDDAVSLYSAAREAATRGGDSTKLGLAVALSGIGSAEAEIGKLEEARSHHELALAIHEELLGPLHPRVAETLTQLGAAYGEMGQAELAIASYRRAITIIETALGQDHPRMASLKVGLAAELLASGQAAESLPLFDDGLARMIAIHGENSKFVSSALNNRGIALRIVGRTLDSRADLLRALGILEAIGDRASIANALSNIGDSYLATEEPTEARRFFTRSLAAIEATYGGGSLKAAYAMHGLGSALLEEGQVGQAVSWYERALALRVKLGAPAKAIASAQGSLGTALLRTARRAQGCELLAAAEAAYRKIGSERTTRSADEVAATRAAANCR